MNSRKLIVLFLVLSILAAPVLACEPTPKPTSPPPKPTASESSTSIGGGGSGGSGCVEWASSDEAFSNIAQVKDMSKYVPANVPTTYFFGIGLIGNVTVTSPENQCELHVRVEALKNHSILVNKSGPAGSRYYNIWIGARRIKDIVVNIDTNASIEVYRWNSGWKPLLVEGNTAHINRSSILAIRQLQDVATQQTSQIPVTIPIMAKEPRSNLRIAVFALAGLLVVAYLILRQKKDL